MYLRISIRPVEFCIRQNETMFSIRSYHSTSSIRSLTANLTDKLLKSRNCNFYRLVENIFMQTNLFELCSIHCNPWCAIFIIKKICLPYTFIVLEFGSMKLFQLSRKFNRIPWICHFREFYKKVETNTDSYWCKNLVYNILYPKMSTQVLVETSTAWLTNTIDIRLAPTDCFSLGFKVTQTPRVI